MKRTKCDRHFENYLRFHQENHHYHPSTVSTLDEKDVSHHFPIEGWGKEKW